MEWERTGIYWRTNRLPRIGLFDQRGVGGVLAQKLEQIVNHLMAINGQESIKHMSLLQEGILINRNGGIRRPSYDIILRSPGGVFVVRNYRQWYQVVGGSYLWAFISGPQPYYPLSAKS